MGLATAELAEPSDSSAELAPRRLSPPPVFWLAIVGVIAVATQLWVYGSWLIGGHAHTIRPGIPVPESVRRSTILISAALIVASVLILVWVLRRCLAHGRLTLDAMLVIGWVLTMWQNPAENTLHVTRFTGSYGWNAGTWASQLPFEVSRGASRVPEPLLFMLPLYLGFGLGSTIIGSWLIGVVDRRWPGRSVPSVLLTAFVPLLLIETIGENLWVRTGVLAYPGGIHGLSLFGGTRWQVPIYLLVLVTLSLLGPAALRYFADGRGSWAERGFTRLKVTGRARTAVRVLAVTGFVNLSAFCCYNLPIQAAALHAGTYPTTPAWLNNGATP